jgi:hypothetical protein
VWKKCRVIVVKSGGAYTKHYLQKFTLTRNTTQTLYYLRANLNCVWYQNVLQFAPQLNKNIGTYSTLPSEIKQGTVPPANIMSLQVHAIYLRVFPNMDMFTHGSSFTRVK